MLERSFIVDTALYLLNMLKDFAFLRVESATVRRIEVVAAHPLHEPLSPPFHGRLRIRFGRLPGRNCPLKILGNVIEGAELFDNVHIVG